MLLAQLANRSGDTTRPVRIQDLLELSYGNPDFWASGPNLDHAYSWLAWLAEQTDPSPELKLALQHAEGWLMVAEPACRRAYAATTSAGAWALLKEWLRATTPEQPWPFPPRELSAKLMDRLKSDLTSEAIATGTDFFAALLERAPEKAVLCSAALACAEVLIANPREATSVRIRRIGPYLPYDLSQRVAQLVEPEYPGLPEWRFADLRNWFTSKYLPYRHWALKSASADNSGLTADDAKAFALDYLHYYSEALAGGEGSAHLAWAKSDRLRTPKGNEVYLLVVLDGLTYPDAGKLRTHIERESPRLCLDEQGLAMAPVPTVTEFAKVSVAKGLVPAQASQDRTRAVYSSADEVVAALGRVSPGGVVVWAHSEPDRTYHWRADAGPENLRREVEAQLLTIGSQLRDIAEKVSAELTLRIIITTDHGRLLTNAVRTQPTPPGMKAHGRAAWGDCTPRFDESGVQLDGHLAYLHPARFGLPAGQGYVVTLSEEAFLTNNARGGTEPFPHGGLFPEEVFIPWVELTRDRGPVKVQISLVGKGEEGRAGEAKLSVTNLGHVRMTITSLYVPGLPASIAIDVAVDPFSTKAVTVALPQWPAKQAISSTSALVTCALPDGALARHEFHADLTTESLYEQQDILGELGGL